MSLRYCSLALGLLALSFATPALAEQISTSEITMVGLNATHTSESGTTKLNANYDNVSLSFTPNSGEARVVDTNGSFTLAGPRPGLIASGCDRAKAGRIFYPSQGSSSDSYRCGENTIQTQGALTRKGDTWTMRGRMTGIEKGRNGDGKTTWDQTQDIVLRISGKSCQVVKVAIVTRTDEDSEYARMVGKKPSVSRTVNRPGSKCAFM